MEDTDLQLNFAEFCLDHFQHNGTAKDEQYKTPLGSNDTSPNGNESESIELVETPSNTYRASLQESVISSASTNNTDICVLDSQYTNEEIQMLPEHDGELENEISDEFVESEDGDNVFLRAADVLDKNEDFTVLQKPEKTVCLCNCEESTVVLSLMDSEYQEERKPSYSGTDSDVEVLMSEEIIDSDWSSGNGLDHVKVSTTPENVKKSVNMNCDDEGTSSSLRQSCAGRRFKTHPSIVKKLADTTVDMDKYEYLSRSQLLQIIHEQEACIHALEAIVKRYEKAQNSLFGHVDDLRKRINNCGLEIVKHLKEK